MRESTKTTIKNLACLLTGISLVGTISYGVYSYNQGLNTRLKQNEEEIRIIRQETEETEKLHRAKIELIELENKMQLEEMQRGYDSETLENRVEQIPSINNVTNRPSLNPQPKTENHNYIMSDEFFQNVGYLNETQIKKLLNDILPTLKVFC
ncbi:MAG: hypothetical protein Q8L27_01820 [archaeon]|nr:hypothetical protein [archaeon]